MRATVLMVRDLEGKIKNLGRKNLRRAHRPNLQMIRSLQIELIRKKVSNRGGANEWRALALMNRREDIRKAKLTTKGKKIANRITPRARMKDHHQKAKINQKGS